MFRTRAGTGEYVRAVRINLAVGVDSGLFTLYDARGNERPLRAGENFVPTDVSAGQLATELQPILFFFDYSGDAAAAAFETFLPLFVRTVVGGTKVKGGFRLPQRLNGSPGITPRIEIRTASEKLEPGAVVHGFIRSA